VRIQIDVSTETFISEIRFREMNKTSLRPEYRREENQDRLVIITNIKSALIIKSIAEIKVIALGREEWYFPGNLTTDEYPDY